MSKPLSPSPPPAPQHTQDLGWGLNSWDLAQAQRHKDWVLLLSLVSCVGLGALMWLRVPDQPTRTIAPLLLAGLTALVWGVSNRWGLVQAMKVGVIGAWWVITASCFLNGGVEAPAVVAYGFSIVFAGWMYGPRMALSATGATLVALAAMVLSLEQGWIAHAKPIAPVLLGSIHAVMCVIGGAFVGVFVSGYGRRLDVLKQEMARIEQRSELINEARLGLLAVADMVQMTFWHYDVQADALRYGTSMPHDRAEFMAHKAYPIRKVMEPVHPEDRVALIDKVRAITSGLESPDQNIEYRISVRSRSRTRQWRWMQLRIAVTERGHNGLPKRLAGASIDVTQRKLMELSIKEQTQRFEQVFNHHPDPMVITSYPDGRVAVANDAALRLMGRSRDEVIGMSVLDLREWPGGRLPEQMVRQLNEQGSYADLLTSLQRVDGSTMHASLTGFLMQIEGCPHVVTTLRDVTELTRAGQALAEHNLSLRLMCDNVPDMIWTKDRENRYQFVNKAMSEQMLLAADTDEPVGKRYAYFAERERAKQPDNPDWYTWGDKSDTYSEQVMRDREMRQFDEFGYICGRFVFLDVRKAPLYNAAGEVVGVVCTARDVTQQKAAEEKLRLASLVLTNSSEAMMIADEQHRIIEVNPAFGRLTGYEPDEVIGQRPSMFRSGRHPDEFYRELQRNLVEKGRWQGELWRRRKSGELFVEWSSISTIYNTDGTPHRFVALSTDITERKKSEELIWSHAYLDALTQLPNRRMFQDRLSQAMKNADRSGQRLALLFIDLDHFKEVNDTEGHDKGDQLLVEAAQRISTCVREADTVARLGGDEFTVILPELQDANAVERVAEQIIRTMTQPFEMNGKQAYVTASIGITVYPEDGNTLEDLLKCADQAMYEAKNQGRNRYRYFTASMQAAAQEKQRLVSDLRQALKVDQFELYFQPLVDLSSGAVVKTEALIRWHHPARGLVSPATFIPLAERSGLIHELGEWVFRGVIRHLQRWRGRYGAHWQVSLNVSPIQVREAALGQSWPKLVEEGGLHGGQFILEITEGILVDDSEQVQEQLRALRRAGLQLAIDDFGTGYSSLSYLNKLDIDVLKIDRSFIRHIDIDPQELALVEAMVVMAHKLSLKVVAEGVENEQQRDILRTIGCDCAQGYLYAPPMPVAEFEAWMDRHSVQLGQVRG